MDFGIVTWLLRCLALLGLVCLSAGCNSQKPSGRVESLIREVERGEVEQSLSFFSSRFVSRHGIGPLRANLSSEAVEIKEQGGIKAITILKEETVGEVSEVTAEITKGNGESSTLRYKLVKEQGAWKIDDVMSGSSPEAEESEPLHPESAVTDVVNWAHKAQAGRIRDWLKSQPQPPVCKATAVDRAALPDEVRYHEVGAPKVEERLRNALDPVLKLVGCTGTQGLVLYRGQNIYAFSLDHDQIAITPGALYFIDPPPDESIFHTLAELRVFLAREVFRQIVLLEKPGAGLNEADMKLRAELKIDYLAALVSLEIDHDPGILDRAAQDIDLFGKPVGVAPGTEGVPLLQQIQDVFGAARQDARNRSQSAGNSPNYQTIETALSPDFRTSVNPDGYDQRNES